MDFGLDFLDHTMNELDQSVVEDRRDVGDLGLDGGEAIRDAG